LEKRRLFKAGESGPWRRIGCYNPRIMTLVEVTYELARPLKPEQFRRLGEFANTYGLRRFHVDEEKNLLRFEYDASRLRESQVEHVLRAEKIAVKGLAKAPASEARTPS
jgi:hypothetical protein